MQVKYEKNCDFPPTSRFILEMIQDRAIVAMEHQQKTSVDFCVDTLLILLSLFSSMRGRQQLSCPVLRPPNGPNARPQDNLHLAQRE